MDVVALKPFCVATILAGVIVALHDLSTKVVRYVPAAARAIAAGSLSLTLPAGLQGLPFGLDGLDSDGDDFRSGAGLYKSANSISEAHAALRF